VRLNTDETMASHGFQKIILGDREKEAIVGVSLILNAVVLISKPPIEGTSRGRCWV
jgi:hypothetical protein